MGPKAKAAAEARAKRNELNRKIQTRHGRIAILKDEISRLELERDVLSRRLPALDKAAFHERFPEEL